MTTPLAQQSEHLPERIRPRYESNNTGCDYHDDHEQRQPQTFHVVSRTRRRSY
jgi:hypothetical protein